jgi:nitrile hydratase
MNGIHDLGGMHGFGPINPEPDEPVFHAAWEGRVFGLFGATSAFAGFSVDEFRHAIENMGAAEYLESSYYEHWLHAFEVVLSRRGFVTPEEIDARVAQLRQGGS